MYNSINRLILEGDIFSSYLNMYINFYKYDNNYLYYVVKDLDMNIQKTENVLIDDEDSLVSLLKYRFGIDINKEAVTLDSITLDKKNILYILMFLINEGYRKFSEVPSTLTTAFENIEGFKYVKDKNDDINSMINEFILLNISEDRGN